MQTHAETKAYAERYNAYRAAATIVQPILTPAEIASLQSEHDNGGLLGDAIYNYSEHTRDYTPHEWLDTDTRDAAARVSKILDRPVTIELAVSKAEGAGPEAGYTVFMVFAGTNQCIRFAFWPDIAELLGDK